MLYRASPTEKAGPPPGSASALVQVLDRYLADLQAGRAPDRARLLADHPELAGQLESCLAGIDFIHRTTGSNDGGEEGHARLGEFRILREIGRGGMGVVYEAEQTTLRRRVALKVLRFGIVADEGAMERFRREAETVARLHHTNVVPIFAVGSEQGVHYFAMQFIEGRNLAEVQAEDGLPRPEDVVRWGLQAAEALEYAHRRGVIHRDVKPSNLLLDPEGVVWLTDFGLAKRADEATLTVAGTLMGTPRYMSPEQAESLSRPVDHRTDIYSLGATLYELATGRPAFEDATPHGVIRRILADEPVPPRQVRPGLPRDLETVILTCLAKDPARRYASAQALADDLRAVLDGRPILARRVGPVGRTVRWARRQRRTIGVAAAAAAAAVLLVGGAAVGWTLYSRARLATLLLSTAEPHLAAEVLDAGGDEVVVPGVSLPTRQPLELPAGDHRVRLSAPGRPTETYGLRLHRGESRSFDVGLDDRHLWEPIATSPMQQTLFFLEGEGRTDLVEHEDDKMRRIDGATGRTLWKVEAWPQQQAARDGSITVTTSGAPPPEDDRRRQAFEMIRGSGFIPPGLARPAPDLDGDGVGDLVWAGRHAPSLWALSGRGDDQGRGRELWLFRAEGGGAVVGLPAVADVDADGTPDLIATFQVNARTWVEAVSGRSGASLWSFEVPAPLARQMTRTGTPETFPAWVGRVGEATRVIVAPGTGVLVLDPATGKPDWEGPLGGVAVRPPILADLDGDGSPDVLLVVEGSQGQRLEALSPSKRRTLWSRPNPKVWRRGKVLDPDQEPDWPLAVDLDGDGASEVVVSASSPPGSSRLWAGVEVLRGTDGEPLWGRRLRTPVYEAEVHRFLAGPDLDGDGHRELFVASNAAERGRTDRTEAALFVDALSGRDGRTLWWWRRPTRSTMTRSDRSAGGGRVGRMAPAAGHARDLARPPGLHLPALGGHRRAGAGAAGRIRPPPRGPRRRRHARPELSDHPRGQHPHRQRHVPRPAGPPAGPLGTPGAARTGRRPRWRRARRPARASRGRDDRLLGARRPRRLGLGPVLTLRGDPGRWDLLPDPDLRTPADLDGDGAPDLLVGMTGGVGFGSTDIAALRGDDVKSIPVLLRAISGRTGRRLWTAEEVPAPAGRGAIFARPKAARRVDLDGDGTPEVAAVIHIDGPFGPSPRLDQLWLMVFSGRDGRLRWRQLLAEQASNHTSEGLQRFAPAPRFAKLDGEADRDIVLAVPVPTEAGRVGVELRAFGGRDGRPLWSHHLPPRVPGLAQPGAALPELAVGDLDGDGVPDLVAVDHVPDPSDGRIARLSGPREFRLVRLDGRTGRPLGEPWAFRDQQWPDEGPPRPVLADLDGEGRDAITLWVHDEKGQRITRLDARGAVLRPRETPADDLTGWSSRLYACDLDGKAGDELVGIQFRGHRTVQVFAGDPEHPLWTRTFEGMARIEEVTPGGPGRPACVVVGTLHNTVVGLDGATGRTLWRGQGRASDPGPSLGDIPIFDSALLHDARPGGTPRVVSRSNSSTVCLLTLPTTTAGHDLASDRVPAVVRPVEADPRLVRPLPWAVLTREAIAFGLLDSVAMALVLLVLPGLALYGLLLQQPRRLGLLLLVPVILGATLAAARAWKPDLPPPYLLFQAVAGLPIAILACFAGLWSIRRRWWRLGLVAVLLVAVASVLATILFRYGLRYHGPLATLFLGGLVLDPGPGVLRRRAPADGRPGRGSPGPPGPSRLATGLPRASTVVNGAGGLPWILPRVPSRRGSTPSAGASRRCAARRCWPTSRGCACWPGSGSRAGSGRSSTRRTWCSRRSSKRAATCPGSGARPRPS